MAFKTETSVPQTMSAKLYKIVRNTCDTHCHNSIANTRENDTVIIPTPFGNFYVHDETRPDYFFYGSIDAIIAFGIALSGIHRVCLAWDAILIFMD